MSLRRRVPLLLAAALLALPVAACGNKESAITTSDTEGTYLTLSGVDYQVQISRQLNPDDPEDTSYLIGVPASQRQVSSGQSWFAVFLRVHNHAGEPRPAASQFEIVDTQDNVYRPVPLGPDNVFRYPGGTLAHNATIPGQESVPYNEPSIGGALLLFKLDNASFENRPLVLDITDPLDPSQKASVDLDL